MAPKTIHKTAKANKSAASAGSSHKLGRDSQAAAMAPKTIHKTLKAKNSAASAGSRLREIQKLRVGSHCSGWLSESQALDYLRVPHRNIFASDSDAAVKKLVLANFHVLKFYDNMLDTPVAKMPGGLDLYVCGFPCQPFSAAGRNKGLADCRSLPMNAMLEYIKIQKQNMAILENVSNFQVRHKAVFSNLVKYLESLEEYTLHYTVLNTDDYGIPQIRKRIYFVLIKTRLLRLQFQWPEPIGSVPISKIYDRDHRGIIIKSKSMQEAAKTKTSSACLMKAFKQLVAMGMRPRATDAIVDIGSTVKFCSFQVGRCPTITKARAQSMAYYSTKLQRRLNVREMMRLQGCNPKRLRTDMLTQTKLAGIIGNAMSINVMAAIILEMLKAACWSPEHGCFGCVPQGNDDNE